MGGVHPQAAKPNPIIFLPAQWGGKLPAKPKDPLGKGELGGEDFHASDVYCKRNGAWPGGFSMSYAYDRELGMDRKISRRDFMNGAAIAVGATLLPHGLLLGESTRSESQNQPGYDPPITTRLRGSHPGSFEIAHSLRDGTFWQNASTPIDTGESYDLIVVGGGISGLAAAYFFREKAGTSVRILILENHDDFGGHAKRNEFHLGGRLQLLNGGTFLIDSPTPYSRVADGLLKRLGIDPPHFDAKFTDHKLYQSLGLQPAIFFDKKTFAQDRLVVGSPRRNWGGESAENASAKAGAWADFLAKTPLSTEVQRDIVRIEGGKIDYMPGLSSAEKKAQLSKMSYRDFLLNVVKADPGVIPFYQRRTAGEWGSELTPNLLWIAGRSGCPVLKAWDWNEVPPRI